MNETRNNCFGLVKRNRIFVRGKQVSVCVGMSHKYIYFCNALFLAIDGFILQSDLQQYFKTPVFCSYLL